MEVENYILEYKENDETCSKSRVSATMITIKFPSATVSNQAALNKDFIDVGA